MARDENVQFQKSLKIEALKGRIVPVPTVQEINPSVDFGLSPLPGFCLAIMLTTNPVGDAYAVEIVTRRAAEVSKYAFISLSFYILKKTDIRQKDSLLQHSRKIQAYNLIISVDL